MSNPECAIKLFNILFPYNRSLPPASQ
jgi:hypothetical protein